MYQEIVPFEGQMLTPSKRKKNHQNYQSYQKIDIYQISNLSVPYQVQKMFDHFQDRKGCVPFPFQKQGTATLPCPCAKSTKTEGVKDPC